LNRVSSLNKLSRTFSELEQKYQRDPSYEELSNTLGVTEEEVMLTYKISGRHSSLDAPFVQGEENSLLDTLTNDNDTTPETKLMKDSLQGEVSRALATLTARESDVICYYYGLKGMETLTLEEIGEKFNITRERVRQIKEKATKRLKHASRSRALRSYLG
jgi:RNA polymerase primary sigma factor